MLSMTDPTFYLSDLYPFRYLVITPCLKKKKELIERK